MKKSLFVLGVAVAALASCTNEEVTEVAQNRAIQFSSFVNNNTKAVTEISAGTLASSEFYVFGEYSTDGTQWENENLFNNELGSKQYYWVQGNQYRFGAYANGKAGKLEGASYEASTQTLTFSNYTPDDTKDLVAATGTADATSAVPSNAVSLNFKHMLAQVAFTFDTEDGNEYVIAISDLKINNAVNTATGTYTSTGDIKWTGTATGASVAAYTYDGFADIANDAETFQQSKLVIPQAVPANANKTTVSFHASIEGAGLEKKENDFTLDLTSPDAEGWKPGYRYNYKATVNGENILNTLVPIEFTASVEEWQDATMGDNGTIMGE